MAEADWDDLRFFLAVHRTGTLSAAARALGVNQSTVSRRIERLGATFGSALLEQRDGRFALTVPGRAALQHAERVEEELIDLRRKLDLRDDQPRGAVRLSVPEGLGLTLIAPRLPAFRAAHPGLELLLAAESPVVNLGRREADLAVRLVRPQQRELVVRRVARIAFSPYASAEYLARRPRKGGLVAGEDLVVLHEELAEGPETEWLLENAAEGVVRVRVRTPLAVLAAVQAGAGVGMLASYLGSSPGLRALTAAPPVERDAFLVFHRALRDRARVRAVCRFVEECLQESSKPRQTPRAPA